MFLLLLTPTPEQPRHSREEVRDALSYTPSSFWKASVLTCWQVKCIAEIRGSPRKLCLIFRRTPCYLVFVSNTALKYIGLAFLSRKLIRVRCFHLGIAELWQLPDFYFKERLTAKARAAGVGCGLGNKEEPFKSKSLFCTSTAGIKSDLFESLNQIFLILHLKSQYVCHKLN